MESPSAGLPDVVGLGEVMRRTGRSRATISRWIDQQKFPRPIANWPSECLAWRRETIDNWFASLK